MEFVEIIKELNDRKSELEEIFDPELRKEIKHKINELENLIVGFILNSDSIYIVYHEETSAPYIDQNDNIWIFTEYKLAKNIVSFQKRKGINLTIKEIIPENNFWAKDLFFNGFEKILINNGKNPYTINASKFFTLEDDDILENGNLIYYYLNLKQERVNPDKTNKKIKIKTLTDNIIDEMKAGKFLLPLEESKLPEELEDIPYDAIPFIDRNGYKLLPIYTDWVKFSKIYPSGFVSLELPAKEIINMVIDKTDIFSIILNPGYFEYLFDYDVLEQVVNQYTRKIHLIRSMHINEDVQKVIKNTPNTAHRVSQPVIYKENNKFFLASFVFYYTRDDIRHGVIDRPLKWIKMDLETGKILEIHDCKKKDFTNADFGKTYEVKISREYDTSQYYYENTFILLDDCRKQILNNEKMDSLKYMIYIERVLTSIPDSYKRFYFDLSMPCRENKTGYLMPSDTYLLFEYIDKYKSAVSNNLETKFLVGLNSEYKINNEKSIYSDWSDPVMLLEYIYYPLYLNGEITVLDSLKENLQKFINSDVPLAFFQAICFIDAEKKLEEKYKTLPFKISSPELISLLEKRLAENETVLRKYTKEKSGKHFNEENLYEESLNIFDNLRK